MLTHRRRCWSDHGRTQRPPAAGGSTPTPATCTGRPPPKCSRWSPPAPTVSCSCSHAWSLFLRPRNVMQCWRQLELTAFPRPAAVVISCLGLHWVNDVPVRAAPAAARSLSHMMHAAHCILAHCLTFRKLVGRRSDAVSAVKAEADQQPQRPGTRLNSFAASSTTAKLRRVPYCLGMPCMHAMMHPRIPSCMGRAVAACLRLPLAAGTGCRIALLRPTCVLLLAGRRA